jgi:hypothetical protein
MQRIIYFLLNTCILVSGAHLGPATNFSPSLFDYFQTVEGLRMWSALSDERTGL